MYRGIALLIFLATTAQAQSMPPQIAADPLYASHWASLPAEQQANILKIAKLKPLCDTRMQVLSASNTHLLEWMNDYDARVIKEQAKENEFRTLMNGFARQAQVKRMELGAYLSSFGEEKVQELNRRAHIIIEAKNKLQQEYSQRLRTDREAMQGVRECQQRERNEAGVRKILESAF